ncbi:MAG: transposase [Firmicutes bacterium]|nr:transposase [Alicyclobacillaceae bacterium]MCL6496421.1 transposase [Bacillota bacterium]
MAYQTVWEGARLGEADPCDPSSKRCSACGVATDRLPLGARTFPCDACGLVLDSGRERGAEPRGLGGRRHRQWPGDAKRPWTGRRPRRQAASPGGGGKSAGPLPVRPAPPPGHGRRSGIHGPVLGNGS